MIDTSLTEQIKNTMVSLSNELNSSVRVEINFTVENPNTHWRTMLERFEVRADGCLPYMPGTLTGLINTKASDMKKNC